MTTKFVLIKFCRIFQIFREIFFWRRKRGRNKTIQFSIKVCWLSPPNFNFLLRKKLSSKKIESKRNFFSIQSRKLLFKTRSWQLWNNSTLKKQFTIQWNWNYYIFAVLSCYMRVQYFKYFLLWYWHLITQLIILPVSV